MRNVQTDICGPGGDWQNGKRHPGQIIHGQNSGRNWRGNAKLREKQKMGNWKNQSSIMPEDYEEFISLTLRTRNSKKPLRMLERNWKRQWLPLCFARQARKVKHEETRGKTNDFKSKLACILEASESTRLRMEESLPNYHEDHIAGRGDNSL